MPVAIGKPMASRSAPASTGWHCSCTSATTCAPRWQQSSAPAELLEAAQLERVGLFAPELIVGLTTTKGSTAVAVGTDRASMLAREATPAELVTRRIHPL